MILVASWPMLKPARVNVMLARLRGVMAIGGGLTPASVFDLLAGCMRSVGQGQIVLVSCSIGQRPGY